MKKMERDRIRMEEEELEREILKFRWKPAEWKPVKPQGLPTTRATMKRVWHDFKDSDSE